ncbi:MAG: PAS domain-containing sensor histidine kinase [Gemmatimonadetes bacterium]|nr:PAS domain-containing sensor histidine kinase [Gemmatimonadota bacterium]
MERGTLQAGDRARQQALLERSEARFRDVIERNADAIVVVDAAAGTVRFVNNAAERLFGRPRDQLISSPFGFPLVSGETTELDLPRDGGPPRVVEMRVVESEWEGRNACIASLRDISDRKDAEANARRLIREQAARSAAEETARRLRFIADAGALLSSSLDYRTTLSNLARLCVPELADWTVVYVVGQDGAVGRFEVAHRDPGKAELIRELRDEGIAADGSHPILEVLKTGQPVLERTIGPDRLRALADDERHLEVMTELGVASFMLVPLVARGIAVGGLALVSSDPERLYTEGDLVLAQEVAHRAALGVDNARLYHEAQDANRAKSDLLAVISHDLRTPLSAIMGYADLLCMGVPDELSEGSRHQVERIRTATRHLVYLIEELLAFAKLDAGHDDLQLREVSAADVVREVAEVVEPLASERGLRFTVVTDERTGGMRTDPGKLRQILVNLIGNAIKFTERGEVRLTADAEDGTVVFTVRDTGVGIAPEHLEQIFQPFWQVPGGKETDGGGTGLGLSVVRRLVTLLGGGITVESTVGSGTVFTVTLPRRPLGSAET